ncbi:MAG: LEPR-XLL domain-containing protein [Pirellulaceae bacterium]|nr:LEPR-XLL domain-containing protein [Planctomycetales bacterium]
MSTPGKDEARSEMTGLPDHDDHRKARMRVESLEPRILLSAGMMDVADDTAFAADAVGDESDEQNEFDGSSLFDDPEIADLDLDMLMPYLASGLAAEFQATRRLKELHEVELSDLPSGQTHD